MNSKNTRKAVAFALLIVLHTATTAVASDVIINGKILSYAEITAMEKQIGSQIAAGIYLSDGDCWANLTNGTSGCLSNSTVDHFSRYGSGSRNAQGDWNHWSDAADGAVGGTGDGCFYTTFGWSNC